ncbi:hypothetical protein [Vibrio spartinae]|uniref:Uncharacterized protein n=1 Tax=Vibrio spartinae TaxID=1918945 RepID=A0A1N6M553_9VIBR|nr:hypothetical protein [Vibrio spartinae]SIO94558.1 hypothetical protein VSP9026_02283 [Vibrio spartinae]
MKTLLLTMALISPFANAEAVYTAAHIDFVFAGYSDGSISFIPTEGTTNPAHCSQTQAYAMLPPSDTKSALSVLLAAKLANKKVYFSVLDNVCHSFPQTDNPGSFPVIQRIGIRGD